LDAGGHICFDGTSVAGIQGLRIYQLNIDIHLLTFIKRMTAFLSSFCCIIHGPSVLICGTRLEWQTVPWNL